MTDKTIRVTEIYPSIQGESTYAGIPCTFIRLTGCPLRCKWCDTVYSFEGGEEMSLNQVLEVVAGYGINLVELTGGEPLAQKEGYTLANMLVDGGYKVLIETSGSEPISGLRPEVHIIMDVKCPDSKMSDRNLWSNIDLLKPTDELKFVLASRQDYDWAKEQIRSRSLDTKAQVLFSCAFGLLKPVDLAAWLTEDRAPWRMQLQMHKYIWNPRAKGV